MDRREEGEGAVGNIFPRRRQRDRLQRGDAHNTLTVAWITNNSKGVAADIDPIVTSSRSSSFQNITHEIRFT